MSEIEEMSTLRLSRNLESYFECWDAEDASFNDTRSIIENGCVKKMISF